MTSRPKGWRELAKHLTEQIQSGLLKPGERLPTEEALQDWSGSSRTTVRTAIAELRRLGLVETRDGKGTFDGKKGTFVLGLGGPYCLRPTESATSSAAIIITDEDGSTHTLPAGTRIVIGPVRH